MANGTTLGTAYVQIIPSMEGTASKISSILNEEGESAGEEAGENTGSSFMSKLASTVVKLAGTLAIGATIKKAFDVGADLEQQLGGVDTLFKDSADTVKQYANEAYKSCGLSANAYMSNVTSFSASLLQGLGGDTDKAAEYANTAMIDMSDNANKFGTDMTSIQNAYQGFAKQNYTMLDNLKLGYGGTKEEMQRLIKDSAALSDTVDSESLSFDNIVEAIHVMQENMGIAGTTTEEASSTFSGSIGQMSSAWDNFLGGLMMSGKDGIDIETYIQPLVDSISTFVFGNLIPAVGRFVVAVVQSIPEFLESALTTVSAQISSLLGGVIDAETIKIALEAIAAAFTAFVACQALQSLPTLINSIGAALTTLSANPVALVVAAIAAIIVVLVELWNNNEEFRTFIIDCWNTISTTISTVVTTISTFLSDAWDTISTTVTTVWTAISTTFSTVWNDLSNIVSTTIATIQNVITTVFTTISTTISNVWNTVKSVTSSVWNGISSTINGIINTIKSVISTVFNAVKTTISNIWNGIKTTTSNVWNGIKTAIETPINKARDLVKAAIDKIKGFFNFKISWPSIPMPHFSISPSGWEVGDLLKGSIPKLGISWYAKAMDEPYMLSKATLIGAGEAGDEVIYGHSQLMNDIKEAVASEQGTYDERPIYINVYAKDQDEKQIAQEVSKLLTKQLQRSAF